MAAAPKDVSDADAVVRRPECTFREKHKRLCESGLHRHMIDET
jgi:hypothetical protein